MLALTTSRNHRGIDSANLRRQCAAGTRVVLRPCIAGIGFKFTVLTRSRDRANPWRGRMINATSLCWRTAGGVGRGYRRAPPTTSHQVTFPGAIDKQRCVEFQCANGADDMMGENP